MPGRTDGMPTVLVENAANLRTGLCARFEHLGEFLRLLASRAGGGRRFGACFDIAHAVAAGYDMKTPAAVARTLGALYRAVGRSRVKLVHANDSRAPVGSSRDRHEHIGRGHVGRRGFGELLSDRTMRLLPWILERPVDRPGDERRDLAAIRRMVGRVEENRG
jgi:deoxyribonuclease-4